MGNPDKTTEIARAALDAISQEDQKTLSSLLHDDIVWRVSEGTALPTCMKGRREIATGFAPWFERKASPLVFDELRFHAADECVIVEVRNHATMNDGTVYNGEAVVIFEIRNDKILEIREYLNPVLFNKVVPT